MNDKQREKLYDTEIAPELARIARKADELGLSFLSVVEWGKDEEMIGQYGITSMFQDDVNVAVKIVDMAARARGNVDGLFIAIARTCRAQKLPHSSIELQRLGIDPDPAKR